jgi:NAD(P)-dependent dehydrogenase (short-subunit alcohol dehydrogenase family)
MLPHLISKDSTEIEKVAQQVLKLYPKIDYLYNNGGISQRSFAIETPVAIDGKLWKLIFSVQLH